MIAHYQVIQDGWWMAIHSNLVIYISAWNDPKKAAHLFSASLPCFTGPERVKDRASLCFMDVNRLQALCSAALSCSLLCMQLIPERHFVRLLQGFHLSWAQQNFGDHNRRTTCIDRVFIPPAVDGWQGIDEHAAFSGCSFSSQYLFNKHPLITY